MNPYKQPQPLTDNQVVVVEVVSACWWPNVQTKTAISLQLKSIGDTGYLETLTHRLRVGGRLGRPSFAEARQKLGLFLGYVPETIDDCALNDLIGTTATVRIRVRGRSGNKHIYQFIRHVSPEEKQTWYDNAAEGLAE